MPNECPVQLPCCDHDDGIMGMISHGVSVLSDSLNNSASNKVVITIPCDSTDTWVVAAYDEVNDIEKVKDPWNNIIAKGKFYHGIRVRRDKKSTVTYAAFLNTISDNWNDVTEKCLSAKEFERGVRAVM